MLKKIFIDNYKCLNQFSIDFSRTSLLTGKNGTGKSTVFEVIQKLQKFILGSRVNGDEKRIYQIRELFDWGTRSKLSNAEEQRFYLTLECSGETYTYALIINIALQLQTERLFIDKSILIDNKNKGVVSTFSLNYYEKGCYEDLFLELISNIFLPQNTIPASTITDHYVRNGIDGKDTYEDFANWYYYLIYEHENWNYASHYKNNIPRLEEELKQVINNFECVSFHGTLDKDFLSARILNQHYPLESLSKGQQALLILYTLIFCTPEESILCINKPELFLESSEIIPWLSLAIDCLENRQLLLISHHPYIIDYLSAEHGYHFEKTDNGSRVKRTNGEEKDGKNLSIEGLVELG
ncbi:MAG: AAA family ATPase [Okeania sp. SIO3B5]|uniref:AAA family ATPase n=1 Tax=Okeania sp. SIO3B5 TaxID=2607811 RepID=UPI0013FFD289|nr:AAA family ATPase [Okeania sp. SIO3B5]NEO56917.1 AAA family ATPase [Okeania sp. SIO3B5]